MADVDVSMRNFYLRYLAMTALAGVIVFFSGINKPVSLPELGAFLVEMACGGTFIMFCWFVGDCVKHADNGP